MTNSSVGSPKLTQEQEAALAKYRRDHCISDIYTTAMELGSLAVLSLRDKEHEEEHVLLNSLVDILAHHVGETGVSEGAVAVLNRKLAELTRLRGEVEQLTLSKKRAHDTLDELGAPEGTSANGHPLGSSVRERILELVTALRSEVEELRMMAMNVKCVYCGEVFVAGLTEETRTTFVAVHILNCPKNPAVALTREVERLRERDSGMSSLLERISADVLSLPSGVVPMKIACSVMSCRELLEHSLVHYPALLTPTPEEGRT